MKNICVDSCRALVHILKATFYNKNAFIELVKLTIYGLFTELQLIMAGKEQKQNTPKHI